MGRGIYRRQAVEYELAQCQAAGLPEALVLRSLIVDGSVVAADQKVGQLRIAVSWAEHLERMYLIVGRVALWVSPMDEGRYQSLRSASLELDERGASHPASWFYESMGPSGSEDKPVLVDVWNVDVVAMMPWTTQVLNFTG